MSIINKMRRQKAVYWANPVPDGTGGFRFDLPVQIDCRWEDSQELYVDDQAGQVLSKAKVYVDRDVKPGEYLWLGKLTDLPAGVGHPLEAQLGGGLIRIGSFNKVPNMKATRFLRTVMGK